MTQPTDNAGPAELEVKFRAGEDVQKEVEQSSLWAGASERGEEHLQTTYFDSKDFALKKASIDLRLRVENGSGCVQCLKAPHPGRSGPFSRLEFEVAAPTNRLDLQLFDEDTRNQIISVLAGAALEPQFETRILRKTATLTHGTSRIEVALDSGTLKAQAKSEAVGELELELVSGDVSDLYALALVFAEQFPLSLDFVSKSAKGYALLGVEAAKPAKAKAQAASPGDTTDSFFAALFGTGLQQFTANWQPLRHSDGAEPVHQLRVALRRFRSFLRLIPKDVANDDVTFLKQAARALATALGDARRLDVLQEFLTSGPLAPERKVPGADTLLAKLASMQSEARARARATIDGRAATVFALRWQIFVHDRPWKLKGSDANDSSWAPLPEFAARNLSKLNRRTLKKGKAMPDLDDTALHELRIALKHLRYGAEAFGPLTRHGKRIKKLINQAAILQDQLGVSNDASEFGTILGSMSKGAGKKAEHAAAFAAGWLAHQRTGTGEALAKAWKDFAELDHHWG